MKLIVMVIVFIFIVIYCQNNVVIIIDQMDYQRKCRRT